MAELSEYIAPIITPDLGSPEFSTSLVEAFNTIDSNFKKIIQAPYLKGDRGASIETVILKRPDHEVDDNPSEYKKLQDAIIRVLNITYYPQDRQAVHPIEVTNDKLPGVEVNSADKLVQEDHFTVFKDFSTNEMYLICPYIFIDARIQYLDQITESNRRKFIDTSSIVTGKYTRNNESVYQWTIDISTNIPKLYFDDQSGYYCWLVNNEKTGIIAQGIKGADGVDGDIILCQGDKVDEGSDSQDSESRIVIKKVYQQQSSSESNGQSISSTVYSWTPVGSNTPDLENHPVLVYGYDEGDRNDEGNYNTPPKYIQFGIAFVGDTAEGTSTSNTSKQYYIVYEDTLDLVKIIRENSIAKLLETISSSGSVRGLYISSEKDGNTIQNVHMFWNDSNNDAHLGRVQHSCVTRGAQDSDSIRDSKLHVNYDTIVNGDSTVGGDIKLQSTQGVQGRIGLQEIQHTTRSIGECELALVPSFNVDLKYSYDIEVSSGVERRRDRTILEVSTPWIGYIYGRSELSGSNKEDHYTLYEACQLVDEDHNNRYIIDITEDDTSEFWTKIPNHKLGISSVFADDNDYIDIHTFQQVKTLYGSVIDDYEGQGSLKYAKYCIDFAVQVVLMRGLGSRVYATVIYRILNTKSNLSVGYVGSNGDEYIGLYSTLTGYDTVHQIDLRDTYLAGLDTLYFDIMQVVQGRVSTLEVIKSRTRSNIENRRAQRMFTWVSSSLDPVTVDGVEYKRIIGETPIYRRPGSTIADPIYCGIKSGAYLKKLNIRQPSRTPIASDYVSSISMRSSVSRVHNIDIGDTLVQGTPSQQEVLYKMKSYITLFPQADVFVNDHRLYNLHDYYNYSIKVTSEVVNNMEYCVLASLDSHIVTDTLNGPQIITTGFQGANYSTSDMVNNSITRQAKFITEGDRHTTIDVRTDTGDLLIANYYELDDAPFKVTNIQDVYSDANVLDKITVNSSGYMQYVTYDGVQYIQGNNLRIKADDLSRYERIDPNNPVGIIVKKRRLCIMNSELIPVSYPHIEGNVRIVNASSKSITLYHILANIIGGSIEYILSPSDDSTVYLDPVSGDSEISLYKKKVYRNIDLKHPSKDLPYEFGDVIAIVPTDADDAESISVELTKPNSSTSPTYSEDIVYITNNQLYGQSYAGNNDSNSPVNLDDPNDPNYPNSIPLSHIDVDIQYSAGLRTGILTRPWIISPSIYRGTFRMCDTRWGLNKLKNGIYIVIRDVRSN